MLRDKNLIPLSHQHQRALALCVRIDRASPISDPDLAPWQAEVAEEFEHEINTHFAAEESVLFPAAERFAELKSLVQTLKGEHTILRQYFQKAEARAMSTEELLEFARQLSSHIRKEERELFEGMQQRMSDEELSDLGSRLQEALRPASQSCRLRQNG